MEVYGRPWIEIPAHVQTLEVFQPPQADGKRSRKRVRTQIPVHDMREQSLESPLFVNIPDISFSNIWLCEARGRRHGQGGQEG